MRASPQAILARIEEDTKSLLQEYQRISQLSDAQTKRKEELEFLQLLKHNLSKLQRTEEIVDAKIFKSINELRADATSSIESLKAHRAQSRLKKHFKKYFEISSLALRVLERYELHLSQSGYVSLDDFVNKELKKQDTILHKKMKHLLRELSKDDPSINRFPFFALLRSFKRPVALIILAGMLGCTQQAVDSKYNTSFQQDRSGQINCDSDDISSWDYAKYAHMSGGFHTLIEGITKTQCDLGFAYSAKPSSIYGNSAANILRAKSDRLLLASMKRQLKGSNIEIEIAGLNKGESQFKILQDGNLVLDVFYHQDKVERIGINTHNFSKHDLWKWWVYVKDYLGKKVNAN